LRQSIHSAALHAFVLVNLAFLLAHSASADVILVDHESTTNGPGTAWANAYDNLEEALSEAASGDELLSDGSY